MTEFQVGDRVEKRTGYQWPGIVVSAFDTLNGESRYVVECIAPGVKGALHIYSANQLELCRNYNKHSQGEAS